MMQSTSNQDLLQILVAVAWIDGEIQPEERRFLEQIASEQHLSSTGELETLLTKHQGSSSEKCYQLLEQYLGSNPNPTDYDNLLTSVSKLIYSDDDIATEEASLLTKIQNLDPQNSNANSSAKRSQRLHQEAIAKIQQLYQKGLRKATVS